MTSDLYLPRARADRLIAAARLVIALFTMLAVSLDPDLAGRATPRALGSVAAAFIVYAVAIALVSWRSELTDRLRLMIHGADYLLYSLLLTLTRAAVSPFFVFFVFWLLCGLLRFNTRGAIGSAILAGATYFALAVSQSTIRSDPGYLILRIASLIAVSLLLVSFGAYERRARNELSKIASWPQSRAANREAIVAESLRSARDLLRAGAATLIWEESEEPWLWRASSRGETFSLSRDAPDTPADVDGFSANVNGDLVEGRLGFELDRLVSADDQPLADVVARLVAARLDQAAWAERMRDTAVVEERIRVARDLHDGVLQSLTGAALQLEAVLRLIGSDDESARARVRNVQEVIESDQRDLRSFITQLRPEPAPQRVQSLRARLDSLAERFERQWDIAVIVDVDSTATALPEPLAAEIYNIINEAASNAAKHAGGSRIDVGVRVGGSDAAITVRDDGHGFPFHGSFDLAALDELKRGPVTLKERVASLNGDLRLHSTPSGTSLEVTLAL